MQFQFIRSEDSIDMQLVTLVFSHVLRSVFLGGLLSIDLPIAVRSALAMATHRTAAVAYASVDSSR